MEVLKNMTEVELNGLRSEFERLGGDDGITIEQFAAVLKDAAKGKSLAAMYLTDQKLHDLFNEIDYNGDTRVSWEEFTMFIIDAAVQGKYEAEKGIQKYTMSTLRRQTAGDADFGGFEVCASVRRLISVPRWNRVLKLTSFANQHRVKLCHPVTLRCIHTTPALEHPAITAEAMPERGLLATSNAAMQVIFWDAEVAAQDRPLLPSDDWADSLPLRQTVQLGDSQLSLRWSRQYNLLFSASRLGKLHYWSMDPSGKDMHIVRTVQAHSQPVFDVLPVDHEVVTASMDSTARIWNLERNVCTGCLRGHSQGVKHLAYSKPHQFLLSGGFDAWAMVWIMHIKDFRPWKLEDKQRPHQGPLTGLFTVEDSPQVITADVRGMVKIWDLRNFQPVQTFVPPPDPVAPSKMQRPLPAVCYIPTTSSIALVGHRETYMLKYDQTDNYLCADDEWVVAAAYNAAARTFITVHRTRVKVWDEFSGVIEQVFSDLSDDEITAFTLCDRGRKFFLGTIRGDVFGFVLSTGSRCQELQGHRAAVVSLAYGVSATGRFIISAAAGGEPQLLVHYDTLDGASFMPPVLHRLLEAGSHPDAVVCAVSPSISLASVGCSTGHVLCSDVTRFSATHIFPPAVPAPKDSADPDAAGNFSHVVTGCEGEIAAMTFLGELPCFVCSDTTGALYVWTVRPHPHPQRLVCRWSNGDLDAPHTPALPDGQSRRASQATRRRTAASTAPDAALSSACLRGPSAPVGTCFHYHQNRSKLYCGDECGGMSVYDLSAVVRAAHLGPCRYPVRFFSDFVQKTATEPPDSAVLSRAVRRSLGWQAHTEEVSSCQCILDPARVTVLTASYDMQVHLWTTKGELIGSLCQGRELPKTVSYASQSNLLGRQRNIPPWGFKAAVQDEVDDSDDASTTSVIRPAAKIARRVKEVARGVPNTRARSPTAVSLPPPQVSVTGGSSLGVGIFADMVATVAVQRKQQQSQLQDSLRGSPRPSLFDRQSTHAQGGSPTMSDGTCPRPSRTASLAPREGSLAPADLSTELTSFAASSQPAAVPRGGQGRRNHARLAHGGARRPPPQQQQVIRPAPPTALQRASPLALLSARSASPAASLPEDQPTAPRRPAGRRRGGPRSHTTPGTLTEGIVEPCGWGDADPREAAFPVPPQRPWVERSRVDPMHLPPVMTRRLSDASLRRLSLPGRPKAKPLRRAAPGAEDGALLSERLAEVRQQVREVAAPVAEPDPPWLTPRRPRPPPRPEPPADAFPYDRVPLRPRMQAVQAVPGCEDVPIQDAPHVLSYWAAC